MNYPSLSLKQDLIDEVFAGAKNGTQKELKQAPSPGSIRIKKYYKEQKELRLQNVVEEECEECEYKTTKFEAMYRHKREKHSVLKLNCTDCRYSNIYPNKVKTHYKQVHMGIKRGRGLDKLKCRRESCEFTGTTNCLELESHSFFFCEKCQLTFERSDSLKFHKDKIHEGLVFNCEHCDTYSTARKNSLERHILSKHSDEDSKQDRKARICQEEGCTYINLNGTLKRHIETKHEGILRFKCHVMNCSFGSSAKKDLHRHSRTHGKESSKMTTPTNGTMSIYICKFENCNFETHLKKYLVKHMKRQKHVTTTELVSADKKTPRKEEVRSELVSGKPQKSLCSISGCDFILDGLDKAEMQNHFRVDHTDSELTENSFIVVNSVMAEAMEILQEIQEIKKENN